MRKYIFSILLSVASAQYNSAQNTLDQNDDYERVYVEAGVFYPVGNLKNRVLPAPNFGFWIKSRVKEDQFFDIGFNFSIQKNTADFKFQKNDSIFKNTSRGVSGMVGFRYNKIFEISNNSRDITVEWFPSFGYAFFMYKSSFVNFANAPNIVVNEYSSRKALSTFHLGQGLKLNIDNVALQVQYQYTPYHLFYDYIENDFGSQSLIFGIVYKQ